MIRALVLDRPDAIAEAEGVSVCFTQQNGSTNSMRDVS